MNPHDEAVAFRARFGVAASVVVRAPGRVNLVGDHTDYTGGLVLPIAIDKATHVLAAPSDEPRIRCHARLYDDTFDIPIDITTCGELSQWQRYVAGVAIVLRSQGVPLRGADLWIGGNLPAGAGLGSSAALEVGVALALLTISDATMPPETLAQLCKQAENEHADAPCGIMDQMICLCAKANHAMRLDCTSLAHQAVPINSPDVAFVVIDSGVRHSIAAGGYAERRRECERALETIARHRHGISSLAELNVADLPECATQLDDVLFHRVSHVVTENERVRTASDALEAGDAAGVGALMVESHASLRDEYEVSCTELDEIVDLAMSVPGVYGARMTGGGFGGCAIALVREEAVDDLLVRCASVRPGGVRPNAFVARAVDGVQVDSVG